MNKRGRYWVFAFNEPEGGLNDLRFTFNTLQEFEEKCVNMINKYTHYQLYDTQTRQDIEGDFGRITKWICKCLGDEEYEETTF
jgi:hypothetical protein